MKIRLLTITDAWKLYSLIRDHFPENLDEEILVIDFISNFIDSIFEKNPQSILPILCLLLEEDESRIGEMTPEQIFLVLVEGFQQNKVFDLYNFFKSLK